VHTIVEGEYHADYVDSGFLPNDIAVVKVTPPFEWSDVVQPVVLAEAGSDVSNETPSTVSGWGAEEVGVIPKSRPNKN
jgi:Trypsin